MHECLGIVCDEIEIAGRNPNYCIVDGVLYTKDKKTLLLYPNGRKDSVYEVPAFVRLLGAGAFYRCDAIKQIRFHDSIDSVGDCGLDYFGVREIIVLTDVKKLGRDFFGVWDSNDESEQRNRIAHKYAWGIFRYENEVEAFLPTLLFEKYGNEGIKITRDMR